MSFIMVLFAFGTLAMISEPPEKIDRTGSLVNRIKDIGINTVKACKHNKNLILGFLLEMFSGGPMIIFEIYIMSWL
jgi:hypothetical protein